MSSMERGGGNGNMRYDDDADSTGAFNNFMMNNNVDINRPSMPVAASGNATNFSGGGFATPMSGGHTILTPGTSLNNHGTSLINSRIFEIKTGEPTSNVLQTSQFKSDDNYGGNHSEMARSLSMPVMESIGGTGLSGNRGGIYDSDIIFSNNTAEKSSAPQRRKSAPANMFDDVIFDQLYNEGGASSGEREDIFADGFHSPPLGTTSPVADTQPPLTLGVNRSSQRRNSEPPNWDLFDAPSPIPMKEKATLLRPQPSRYPFDATAIFATKTGDDSDRTKHVFDRYPDERGRSMQQKRNAPIKRSLSADPLMQSVTADYVSRPSDDHNTNDFADIFNYLNPEERQHLEQLGIYSREKPKRRRSAPLPTEEILFEELNNCGKNEYREHKTSSLPSSFSSADMLDDGTLVETCKNGQTSDLVQMILGMKKVDSVQGYSKNMPLLSAADGVGVGAESDPIAQTTNVFPSLGVSQLNQYLPASNHQAGPTSTQHTQYSSNNSAMNFNPLYTSQPIHQSINMPHNDQNADLSALSGHQKMTPLQQSPVDTLNPNTSPATINENELANILDAVTETHNNLQLLQSAVARYQDPKAVESITKAFELTAACSQFVLLSQYNTAHNVLNQAWAHIKIVESRLSLSGTSASKLPTGPSENRNEIPILSLNEKPLCLPQKSKKKKTAKTTKTKPPKLQELPPQSKDDPEVIMTRLNALMERTIMSQKNLQKYDKQNGLPRSHAQTMISTSRSRKQLQKGIVLKKLVGNPLIYNQQDGDSATQKETTAAISRQQTPA